MHKRYPSIVRLATILLVSGGLSIFAAAEPPAEPDSGPALAPPAPVTGHAAEYIVIRKLSPTAATQGPNGQERIAPGGPDLETLKADWRVTSVDALSPTTEIAGQVMLGRAIATTDHPLGRVQRLHVPTGTDVAAMADAFAACPEVEYAEVDPVGGIAAVVPNDPYFSWQWGLRNIGQSVGGIAGTAHADIGMPDAWEQTTGSAQVVVAVLDTGVDANHPELNGRVLTGWNTYNNSADTSDVHGHGTRVAGIIAAAGNDGNGIAGVAWETRIMPLRVVAADGTGNESHCAAAIVWATDNGADIISMSLQYYGGSNTLRNAIDYAASRGVLLVAASGNDLGRTVAYPARFASCIAVGATTQDDNWASFSNYGAELELAAPGENVYSLALSGAPNRASGTSFAAPHVSGVAALMRAFNPYRDARGLRNALKEAAHDVNAVGWDEFTGHGRLNAVEALALVDPAGDMNCDGYSDFFDVPPFVQALTDAGEYVIASPGCDILHADVNRDGKVDYFDIDPFIERLLR